MDTLLIGHLLKTDSNFIYRLVYSQPFIENLDKEDIYKADSYKMDPFFHTPNENSA